MLARFCWSIGTQVVLGNPLCTLAFTAVVWHFFKERIEYEEYALVHHIFGTYLHRACVQCVERGS